MGPWIVEVADREELGQWLAGGPPGRTGSTVMVVRGDGPTVRLFLPNAADAAKQDPKRAVVWARRADLFDPVQSEKIFGAGDWALAGDGCVVVFVKSGGKTVLDLPKVDFETLPD